MVMGVERVVDAVEQGVALHIGLAVDRHGTLAAEKEAARSRGARKARRAAIVNTSLKQDGTARTRAIHCKLPSGLLVTQLHRGASKGGTIAQFQRARPQNNRTVDRLAGCIVHPQVARSVEHQHASIHNGKSAAASAIVADVHHIKESARNGDLAPALRPEEKVTAQRHRTGENRAADGIDRSDAGAVLVAHGHG